jgi:hypothetical protein
MFENAREYLARVVAWPQPGEPGFINLHWTFPPTNPRPDGKPAWTGRAVTSAGEAAKALEFALKAGSNTLDVYACMSSQMVASEKVTKGKAAFKYNAPIRLAQNAMYLKSFFIDVDFGKVLNDGSPDPRSYATAEEAITELMLFVSKAGLPKPTMVVSTGGGFHVYWCISERLSPQEWTPLAFALAEATKHFGLKCDTQCTVDSVRVLRIPDTFNRKKEPARAVRFIGPRLDFDYNLDRIRSPLAIFVGRLPAHTGAGQSVDRTLFPPRPASNLPSDLELGLDDLFPPVRLANVAQSCGFVADALATGGALLANPLWNITTLISTFTEGGRADAHLMGNQHAGYTKESTDEFFDRKDRERLQRGLGWPSCATISATGASACKGCPLLSQGKSPLNFDQPKAANALHGAGSGAVPAQATLATAGAFGPAAPSGAASGTQFSVAPVAVTPQGNDLPTGFFRDARGIVSKVMVDPNNPNNQISIAISDYPMLNAWLEKNPGKLHFQTEVEPGKVDWVDMEMEIVGQAEMRKVLQRQGFMLRQNDKHSGDFFVSWIQQLQKVKGMVASAPYGWQDKGGQTEGFIFGGQLWTPAGSSPSATADPVLSAQYKPKGSDAYWLDAVKLVTMQGRPDLEAIVASAFAAPLVMFTGHSGMLMSAYSKESGIGKTTALRIAQAVWGDPIKAAQGQDDTYLSVMNKIGAIRSLPVYWDEIKTEEANKRFVNIAFQLTSGRERSRLTQHVKLREQGHWQTLLVSANNDSLVDHITQMTSTTLAGLYRIFEYPVIPAKMGAAGTIRDAEASVILAKLNNNHGDIGLKYAQWLGKNFKQIETDMAKLAAEIGDEVHAQKEERFWTGLISCILLGARYANQLGLGVFDEPELRKFMIEKLAAMRTICTHQTVDMTRVINVSSIMSAFLKDMQKDNKVIFTDRVHVAAGRPPAVGSPHAVKLLSPSDTSRINGIAVQVGRNDKIMRISSTAFGEWLKKNGKSRHILMEALTAAMTITPVVGFLGGGTGLAFTKENLLQIDLASSNEMNFVDEIQ